MNREPTVPHTVALPIELYPPFYAGVIRTPNGKYQKFMTYRLVYSIFREIKKINGLDGCHIIA